MALSNARYSVLSGPSSPTNKLPAYSMTWRFVKFALQLLPFRFAKGMIPSGHCLLLSLRAALFSFPPLPVLRIAMSPSWVCMPFETCSTHNLKYIPPPIHLVLEALEFITRHLRDGIMAHNLAPEGTIINGNCNSRPTCSNMNSCSNEG